MTDDLTDSRSHGVTVTHHVYAVLHPVPVLLPEATHWPLRYRFTLTTAPPVQEPWATPLAPLPILWT